MADGEEWSCSIYDSGIRFYSKRYYISQVGADYSDIRYFSSILHTIPEGVFEMVHLKQFLVVDCLGLTPIAKLLSRLTELEEIRLHRVRQLPCLPDSIGSLMRLSILNLSLCPSLTCLPSSMENMCSLRELSISYCNNLTFSKTMKIPPSLKTLTLQGCVSVGILPDTLGSLGKLDISHCVNFTKLPDGMDSLEVLSLGGLPILSEIPVLPEGLSEFTMFRCENIKSLDNSFSNVTGLTYFAVRGCCSLTSIPNYIGRSVHLKSLIVTGCDSIKELPESIGGLSSLEYLDTSGCRSIKRIPSSFYRCIRCNRCELSEYTEYPPPHIVNLGAENIRRFLCYHDDKAKIFMAAMSKRHRLPNELWHLIYTKFMPAKIYGCNALKECKDLPFILKISGRDNLFLGSGTDKIDISRLTGFPDTVHYTAETLDGFVISRNIVRLDPNSKVRYRVRDGVEVDLPMFEI